MVLLKLLIAILPVLQSAAFSVDQKDVTGVKVHDVKIHLDGKGRDHSFPLYRISVDFIQTGGGEFLKLLKYPVKTSHVFLGRLNSTWVKSSEETSMLKPVLRFTHTLAVDQSSISALNYNIWVVPATDPQGAFTEDHLYIFGISGDTTPEQPLNFDSIVSQIVFAVELNTYVKRDSRSKDKP